MGMRQDGSWSSSSLTVVKINDLNKEVDLQFPACNGGCPNLSKLRFTEDKQSIECSGIWSTFCDKACKITYFSQMKSKLLLMFMCN